MKNYQDDSKKYSLYYQLRGSRQEILSEVFKNIDLDGMRERLQAWLYACLIDNWGAYDRGDDRKMLMKFCEDLERVIEAFYIESRVRERLLQKSIPEVRKVMKKYNKCYALSKAERQNPASILKEFAKSYRKRYVKAELYSMLEVVVTSEDDNTDRERFSAITFFQCLSSLVKLLYLNAD